MNHSKRSAAAAAAACYLLLASVAGLGSSIAAAGVTVVGTTSDEGAYSPGTHEITSDEFFASALDARIKEIYYEQPYSRTSNETYLASVESQTFGSIEATSSNWYEGNATVGGQSNFTTWLESALAAEIVTLGYDSLPDYAETDNETYASWLQEQAEHLHSVYSFDSLQGYAYAENNSFSEYLEEQFDAQMQVFYQSTDGGAEAGGTYSFGSWIEEHPPSGFSASTLTTIPEYTETGSQVEESYVEPAETYMTNVTSSTNYTSLDSEAVIELKERDASGDELSFLARPTNLTAYGSDLRYFDSLSLFINDTEYSLTPGNFSGCPANPSDTDDWTYTYTGGGPASADIENETNGHVDHYDVDDDDTGSDTYLTTTSTLDYATKIEFYHKMVSYDATTYNSPLMKIHSENDDTQFYLSWDTNDNEMNYWDGSYVPIWEWDLEWHHYLLEIDNSTDCLNLSVDGVLVGENMPAKPGAGSEDFTNIDYIEILTREHRTCNYYVDAYQSDSHDNYFINRSTYLSYFQPLSGASSYDYYVKGTLDGTDYYSNVYSYREGAGDGLSVSYIGIEDYAETHTFEIDAWGQEERPVTSVDAWDNVTGAVTNLGTSGGTYHYDVLTSSVQRYSVGVNVTYGDDTWEAYNLTNLVAAKAYYPLVVENSSIRYSAGEWVNWQFDSAETPNVEITSPNGSTVVDAAMSSFNYKTNLEWDLGWYVVNASVCSNSSSLDRYVVKSFELVAPAGPALSAHCAQSVSVGEDLTAWINATAGDFAVADLIVSDNVTGTNHSVDAGGGNYNFTYADGRYVSVHFYAVDTEGNQVEQVVDGVVVEKSEPDINLLAAGVFSRGETIAVNNTGDSPGVIEVVSPNGTTVFSGAADSYEFDSSGCDLGYYNASVSVESNSSSLGAVEYDSFLLVAADFPGVVATVAAPATAGSPLDVNITVSAGDFNVTRVLLWDNQTGVEQTVATHATDDVSGEYVEQVTPSAGGAVTAEVRVMDADNNWINLTIADIVVDKINPNASVSAPGGLVVGDNIEMASVSDCPAEITLVHPNGTADSWTGTSVDATAYAPGWYLVNATVESNSTHLGASAEVNVHVANPVLPDVEMSFDAEADALSEAQYSINVTAGSRAVGDVEVTFSGVVESYHLAGSGAGTHVVSETLPSGGVYQIDVRVTDSYGDWINVTHVNCTVNKLDPTLSMNAYPTIVLGEEIIYAGSSPSASAQLTVLDPGGAARDGPTTDLAGHFEPDECGWWTLLVEQPTSDAYLNATLIRRFQVVLPEAPVIGTSYVSSAVVGETVSFNVTTSPGHYAVDEVWVYESLGGTNSSGNRSFALAGAGEYTCVVSVNDSEGNWYNLNVSGLVSEKSPMEAFAVGPGSGVLGEPMTWEVPGWLGADVTLYHPNGTVLGSGAGSIEHTLKCWDGVGWYSVNVTYAGNATSRAFEFSYDVKVNVPVASVEWIGFPQHTAAGTPVVIYGHVESTNGSTIVETVVDSSYPGIFPETNSSDGFHETYVMDDSDETWDLSLAAIDSAGGYHEWGFAGIWVHRKTPSLSISAPSSILAGDALEYELSGNQTWANVTLLAPNGTVLGFDEYNTSARHEFGDGAEPGWYSVVAGVGYYGDVGDKYFCANVTSRFELLPKNRSVQPGGALAQSLGVAISTENNSVTLAGAEGVSVIAEVSATWVSTPGSSGGERSQEFVAPGGHGNFTVESVEVSGVAYQPGRLLVCGEEVNETSISRVAILGWDVFGDLSKEVPAGTTVLVEVTRYVNVPAWIAGAFVLIVGLGGAAVYMLASGGRGLKQHYGDVTVGTTVVGGREVESTIPRDRLTRLDQPGGKPGCSYWSGPKGVNVEVCGDEATPFLGSVRDREPLAGDELARYVAENARRRR